MLSSKNKSFFKKIQVNTLEYDWGLVLTILFLSVFGLGFFASSLSTPSINAQGLYQTQFLNQLFSGFILGGGLCYFLSRTNYQLLFGYKNLLFGITLLCLLFLAPFAIYSSVSGLTKKQVETQFRFLPIAPEEANNAIRWINLPVLPNFQPSELVKLTLLIYTCAFLAKYDKEELDFFKLKRPLYAFVVVAGLILVQPDLGTVLIIFGILFSAIWGSSKISSRFLSFLAVPIIIIAVAMAFGTGYRERRIQAFYQTVFDLQGTCSQNIIPDSVYQICQVTKAIKSGGLWGKGYGNSDFKQLPRGGIPELQTDAIIAVVGEEMGFIFTSMFLSLYLILFWRAMKIADLAPDSGGKGLAIGISVWIVSQAFLNIAGITGLLPLKGLPLPFVSRGGTSILITLAAMGVLLNISKQGISKQELPKKV